MTNEILDALARANIVASIAILVVLALREPVRRVFGARIAYALWSIVLCAPLAGFLPPPSIDGIGFAASCSSGTAFRFDPTLACDFAPFLIAIWAAGVIVSAGVLIIRQTYFWRNIGVLRPALPAKGAYLSESTSHSPLVAGLLAPKIILPADFSSKFNDEERALVLAHEQVHVDRGDLQINLLVAFLQCLNWFNPLIHFAMLQIRLDQEIACDADVMAIYPQKQRSYAEAMLKNVLPLADAPVGCFWPSRAARLLKTRIALLKQTAPIKAIRRIGVSFVAVASLSGAYASWAAQPPKIEAPQALAIYREMAWGDPKAKVTVLEYASLTCPHCAEFANGVFPKIKKAYIDSGKIRFVFRDLPTDGLAAGAAIIARCAPEDRGKTLVEVLFKNQREWEQSKVPLDSLKQYAALSGMTPADVDACLQNQALLAALQDEQKKAITLYKVTVTPTFFIGDEKSEGVSPDPDKSYKALSEIIEAQLKKAK